MNEANQSSEKRKQKIEGLLKEIIESPVFKKLGKRVYKKDKKYYSLLSLPLHICLILNIIGILSNIPSFFITTATVSFTMFGMLLGFYITHRFTQAELLQSIITQLSTEKATLEDIKNFFSKFEEYVEISEYTISDKVLIVSYFIVGFFSTFLQTAF